MQTKLAFQLNNIFKYISIFCIIFIWSNYYYHNFLGCVIISVFLTSLICFILSNVFYTKQQKVLKSNQEKQACDNTLNQLLFLNNTEIIDYFYLVLKNQDHNTTKQNDHIIFKDRIIIPYFNYELDTDNFLKFYSEFRDKQQIIFLSYKISSNLTSFIANFDLKNITFIYGPDVYTKIILPSNIKPQTIVLPTKPQKLTFLKICQHAFSKRNSRNYFLSGVLVMFSSLFYKYGLYYQIIGTLLFCFSLYSKFNTRFNRPNQSTNIFD